MNELHAIMVRNPATGACFPDLELLFRRVPFEQLLTLEHGMTLWMKHSDKCGFSRAVFLRAIDLRAHKDPRIKIYVQNAMALADVDIGLKETETHRVHECVDTVGLGLLLARYPEALQLTKFASNPLG